MRNLFRAALMLATTATMAVAQGKPVIAVLYFDNNSWGKDAADYEGVGKGIADMLVTDMASNPNLTVVERERIQSLLVEQNLTKEKTIAPETAIRLGRIIGAQYMVTGGFTHDGKGSYVLTSRVINVETSQISHPVRLTSKGDDVLGLINQLSTKLNSELKLPALRVGDATPATSPAPTAAPAAANAAVPQPADRPVDAAAPAAKPADATPAQPTHVAHAPAKSAKKMDIKTAMLYSKALEEQDAGNLTKAAELFRQVVDKFPDYAPARAKLEKVSRS
jgi:TolB-like protein